MTPVREWMDSHGIDYQVAKDAGLYARRDTLYAPYERPDGSVFERYREFPGGVWMQPRGETLGLWWPLGRATNTYVLLCEGEGDTLAAASVIEKSDHPGLNGLCPVGLPGVGMKAERIVEEFAAQNIGGAFVCLDGDLPGREATKKIVTALTAADITAIPVHLPEGTDLSEHLGWGTDGDPRDFVLANLLADSETYAEDNRKRILMDDINRKLGRQAA
jgi:hypothetical protein